MQPPPAGRSERPGKKGGDEARSDNARLSGSCRPGDGRERPTLFRAGAVIPGIRTRRWCRKE